MKRLLAWLVIFFSLGIIFASRIKIPPALIYFPAAVFVILAKFSLKKELRFKLFILGAAFALGIASFRNTQNLPACHITKYIYYQGSTPYLVKGVIDNEPQFKGGRTAFILKAEEIQVKDINRQACGKILVYLKGSAGLSYGEELILKGDIRRPFSRSNRQAGSFRNYLLNQGIFFIMRVSLPACAVKLNRNKGAPLKRFAFWLKNKMERIIFQYHSHLAAGIADAMILGEKSNVLPLVYNAMIKSGTVHILPRLYTKMPSVAL